MGKVGVQDKLSKNVLEAELNQFYHLWCPTDKVSYQVVSAELCRHKIQNTCINGHYYEQGIWTPHTHTLLPSILSSIIL